MTEGTDKEYKRSTPQPSQVPIAPGVTLDGPPPDPADAPQPGETVSSTSDQRTVNNVMRHEYKVLTDAEKASMKIVKDIGLDFHKFVGDLGDSRELKLAQVKIEEAVMWATKAITG